MEHETEFNSDQGSQAMEGVYNSYYFVEIYITKKFLGAENYCKIVNQFSFL